MGTINTVFFIIEISFSQKSVMLRLPLAKKPIDPVAPIARRHQMAGRRYRETPIFS
jgi:hypothetical protein